MEIIIKEWFAQYLFSEEIGVLEAKLEEVELRMKEVEERNQLAQEKKNSIIKMLCLGLVVVGLYNIFGFSVLEYKLNSINDVLKTVVEGQKLYEAGDHSGELRILLSEALELKKELKRIKGFNLDNVFVRSKAESNSKTSNIFNFDIEDFGFPGER